MQQVVILIYKSLRRVWYTILRPIQYFISAFLFYSNGVQRGSFQTSGVPFVSVARGGRFTIGNRFKMNNSIAANPIGRIQKCSFFVDRKGTLLIGNGVAMSYTAIYCSNQVTIDDNVMIGGGTCIYDTDFHPLTAADRLADNDEKTASAAVTIGSNVFIGANCTILKGVKIGANSIVGACSVVTKSIPPNEIWGGNPAKFIKSHSIILNDSL
jgi:acetyltransferase-like isoleucine patch superfamily enzyme